MRHKAHAVGGCTNRCISSKTRPSLGPSTRARRSSLCTAAQASVVGRSIRHHGWANPRKWEEPALGSSERTKRGSPRVTLSRKGKDGTRRDKEGDQGLRPCEDQESGSGCSHVDGTLQKSVGDGWSRISSANALQKERSGSSERGPSSERKSAGETVGGRFERKTRRESDSPLKTGEDRRKAQGGERSSSSGPHIAKSGARVVGPGL